MVRGVYIPVFERPDIPMPQRSGAPALALNLAYDLQGRP